MERRRSIKEIAYQNVVKIYQKNGSPLAPVAFIRRIGQLDAAFSLLEGGEVREAIKVGHHRRLMEKRNK